MEKEVFVENSIKECDILVVGNGIAARCLLWEMTRHEKFVDKIILHVADNDKYPDCSTRTTSVVSLGAHSKGISPLGDLLCDSGDFFQDFVQEFNPLGVYPSKQFYICPDKEDSNKYAQFLKRYLDNNTDNMESKFSVSGVSRDSFIIKPEELFAWQEKEFQNKLKNYSFFKGDISELKNNQAMVRDKNKIHFKQLFLCTGAYTPFIFENKHLPNGKPVSGSYYIWENINLFNEDLVLSKGHFNIIYRNNSNELLFGGTSQEGFIHEHNLHELEENYNVFKEIFNSLKLPEISDANIFTGIRHKGKKRMPFFGKVQDDIYALNALYKNGFSFPFYGAQQIIKSIID